MPWPLRKNTKSYALIGDRQHALLAVRGASPTGLAMATPLGWADRSLTEDKGINQLIANVPKARGEVAISLTLDQFEVLNLSINKVPREVIAKVLPFNIAKVLDEPLSDFIYDWQVVKELKDSLQLNVFLFPATAFQELRTTLNNYNLQPLILEPDVFSACAFLESRNQLPVHEASMIVLLWPDTISIAIYDNHTLLLTRDVNLRRPMSSHPAELESAHEHPADTAANTAEPNMADQDDSLFDASSDDLLANFLIETKRDENTGAMAESSQAAPTATIDAAQPAGQGWATYINQVSLELMRTRDYFNSVVKGNQIKTAFIGGGEEAWEPLASELGNGLGITIEHLLQPEQASFDNDLFEAISIGVLS